MRDTNVPAMDQRSDFDAQRNSAASPELERFREELNHKLRTPLNAVIGFAELLAMDSGAPHRAGDVEQILTAARGLLAVVDRELTPSSPAPPSKPAAPERPPSTCDIIYIEDDDVNFMLVERILEYRPGLTLKHAWTGQMGINITISNQPKMVLLDLNLPDIHGGDVLQALRANPATADIPVVVLSANATNSHIERLLTAGARNYITKPFDIEPFLAVIDEFTADVAMGNSKN